MKRAIPPLFALLLVAACGGDGDEDAADTDVQGSAGDWCAVAKRVEAGEDAFETALDGDVESVKAGLEAWRALLDEAAESAPQVILADVNTTADGVDHLAKSLERVDYDVTAALADDDFAGLANDMQIATERVKSYTETECGIVAPATNQTSESAAGDVVYSGDMDSDWCVAAREIEVVTAEADQALGDPETARRFFADVLPEFEALLAVAPEEIASEVGVSVEGFRRLEELLEAAGFDILNADLGLLDDEVIGSARDVVADYNEQVCGIQPDSGDSADGSFDPADGTIRDQVIATFVQLGLTEQQAACLVDSIDFTDPNAANDEAAMLAAMQECGVTPSQLAEIDG